ncbi:DNA-binding domain-containing protein [Rhizobium sp. TRM95111]|uniref:HvfC/BufC N-terminal domain-containing protein n=1 Tax=Rhizobium alarense TaxID=2846851 RepID=UPI001F207262|nr:DNA-binding domain-containing protein [Rhizobium alarense]MCF3640350.1 DNA-binding domain-containing protein [Rhizobium alarense]
MQDRFSAALLDPDRAVPAGVTAPRGGAANRRFAVYRNNVVVGLVAALGEIFPTVRRLVGDSAFRAVAEAFVRESPPRSPLLFRYGESFPAFLETFAPFARLTYLPDVARIERLWLDSWHAGDAEPLDAAQLSAGNADPTRLTFMQHPAVRIVACRTAAVSIVMRDRAGVSLAGLDPRPAEWGLVTRRTVAVELNRLSCGGHAILAALLQGETLGEASAEGLKRQPDLDIAGTLTTALVAGAFAAIGS